MRFMSVKEAAQKWKISERSVHKYCEGDRIAGIQKFGRSWAIPADAEKPADKRRKKPERPCPGRYNDPEYEAADTADIRPAKMSKSEICRERNLSESEAAVQPNLPEAKAAGNQKAGAVITAAGIYGEDGGVSPFVNLGTTSLIRRIVLTFQQAHVSPIVVVTGYRSWEVEHHLSDYGVIFIRNEDYESGDKFASARLGLEFLKDKCSKVFFASLKIPMFIPDTLREMTCLDSRITIPRFREQNGHPLLLDAEVIPEILKYRGSDGMRGAMESCGWPKKYLCVEDEGVLLSTENIARLEESLTIHNEKLLHPFVRLSLEKDRVFFDARAKLLLFLIQEFHSVQGACRQMAISRGKAWDLIGRMEAELGFTVVERQQGGSRERKTRLTEKGKKFLEFFQDYEDDVKKYASRQFALRFTEFKKNNGIRPLADNG